MAEDASRGAKGEGEEDSMSPQSPAKKRKEELSLASLQKLFEQQNREIRQQTMNDIRLRLASWKPQR